VQPTQVATENTDVKKLALGNVLSSFYPKGIVTSIAIEMVKHVKAYVNPPQINK
jgi:hypothetical protein